MAHPVTPLKVAPALAPDETLDTLFDGALKLVQRRDGYRFSVDPLLLGAFVGKPRGRIVDLGTGCGIIPVLLAARGAESVIGVELQQSLFQLAWRNVALNRFEEQIYVLNADLRQLRGILPPDTFDLVVSNPPYVAAGAGNVNPSAERALARHELQCSLSEVAAAARYLLRNGGSFKIVFPSARLAELLAVLAREGLEPKLMRLVHPIPDRPAKLVLVEAIKGAGVVLEVLAPLFLHDEQGGYTDEARRILGETDASFDRDLSGRRAGGRSRL